MMNNFNTIYEGNGERLDTFTATLIDGTRSKATKLIESGCVTVNGKTAAKNTKLKNGDNISVSEPEPEVYEVKAQNIPLDIIYEDNDVLVVNKPKGMVVHPAAGNYSGTLVNALLFHCKEGLSGINGVIRPGIVHRIDKDTSGLLVVAKNDIAHNSLALQIKEHKAERVYRAVVIGNPKEDEGTIDKPIARHPTDRKKMAIVTGGREAVTHFKVLERFQGFAYCEMRLETGRTHQIRVHMASIGHPLMGDTVYGGGSTQFEKKHPRLFENDRAGQALFAMSLGFDHPKTAEHKSFCAPEPSWMSDILKLLRENTVAF
jgi:23S rRNA pseudouridine1911/1915/1917 synthase